MVVTGVIGAGVMGTGVAQCLAQSKMEVILLDITEEELNAGMEKIKNNLRFQTLFNKGESENPEQVCSRIKCTTDFTILKKADFIIENVTESWQIKKAVYEKINGICNENCIFLVNTSCISITKIASLLKNPEKVIGVHFMNPVPMKTTVEVIKGYYTSEETVKHTMLLLKDIGKDGIIVNDFPGFVSNRISHLFMNEAAYVVQDQVASPADIDDIFKKCYGHKMGPLETADLIGIDTVVNSLEVLYESFQDSKFRCCPLLRKMVDAGLLGCKSGKGFYNY